MSLTDKAARIENLKKSLAFNGFPVEKLEVLVSNFEEIKFAEFISKYKKVAVREDALLLFACLMQARGIRCVLKYYPSGAVSRVATELWIRNDPLTHQLVSEGMTLNWNQLK